MREMTVVEQIERLLGLIHKAEDVSFWWMHRADDDEDLIRWLALTYGDNDPLFGFEDPTSTVDLEFNERLRRTWMRVVRGEDAS